MGQHALKDLPPGAAMLDLRNPPPQPLISASILSADFGTIAAECRDVLSKGADLLHLDVMDGHFAPNLTMGVDMCRGVRHHFPDAFLDVHLMVERPDLFVEPFAQAGANHVSFHLEVCRPLRPGGLYADRIIKAIHKCGLTAGLVVNPATDPAPAAPYLAEIDLVLVMSVNPGYSGQKFMPEVLPTVRWFKRQIGPQTRIEIDGGINPETARTAVAAGVDVMVTASALFGAPDRAAVLRALHAAGQ
jgi:ribulose-phosphate 3-epimerase